MPKISKVDGPHRKRLMMHHWRLR